MSSSGAALAERTADESLRIEGISHLAIPVRDLDEAVDFYCGALGFTPESAVALPECGTHAVLTAASGQYIALSVDPDRIPPTESGVHSAYRITGATRNAILKRLAQRGVEVFSYREVRPAEARDNCYLHDPSGNRVQLVISPDATGDEAIGAIDHAAVQTIDIEWCEEFYVGRLGLSVDCVVGWRTEDYVLARRWRDGEEDIAPGSMRLDKRYSTIHGTDPVPRPNMQLFVKTGANVLGMYLASQPFQHPPEEAIVGTPRVAFRVSEAGLEAIAARLAAMPIPFAGPVAHAAGSPLSRSLFCKDPGANFIEFCC